MINQFPCEISCHIYTFSSNIGSFLFVDKKSHAVALKTLEIYLNEIKAKLPLLKIEKIWSMTKKNPLKTFQRVSHKVLKKTHTLDCNLFPYYRDYKLESLDHRWKLISLFNWHIQTLLSFPRLYNLRVAEINKSTIKLILSKRIRKNSQKITLRNQTLNFLPSNIGLFTTLNSLTLDWNAIKAVPTEIGLLTNLQHLDLRKNKLKRLPREIGYLTLLTYLRLSGNQLKDLPSQIGLLTNLVVLRLKENHLSNLPLEVGRLTQLKKLNLIYNDLKKLPSQIGNLNQLTLLNLYGNKLKFLPAEITQLTNLQSLHLNCNQLVNLPRNLGQMQELVDLHLKNNQLRSLPKSMSRLQNLWMLDLCQNYRLEIPRIIKKIPNLQHLYIDENKFTTLTEILGHHTRMMIYLDKTEVAIRPKVPLSRNKFETLYKIYLIWKFSLIWFFFFYRKILNKFVV